MKTGFALISLLVVSVTYGAPATAPTPAPNVRELTVTASPAPEPALQYRLIPNFSEQTRGDAAPLYLMAFLQKPLSDDEKKMLAEVKEHRGNDFPLAKAKELLDSRKNYFENLDLAARRENCRWELPYREQGFSTLMPHLSPCRTAAELLCLRARVQMAEGNFDEAVRSLRSGFALVEHLKNDAVLVQGMVAMGLSAMLLEQVLDMEQAKNSPNLYWALAGLPRPVVNLRAMGEAEAAWKIWLMPELKDRRPADLTAAEVAAMLSRLEGLTAQLTGQPLGIAQRLEETALIATAAVPARQWLLSRGYPRKRVDEMPPIQLVGIYFLELYEHTNDATRRWLSLPYWQARQGLAEADDQLRNESARTHNPLLTLLPAMAKLALRAAQADRRIAMAQTVEALRAYAAAHDGKFPSALTDLTDTPAPLDPLTGRSFDYQLLDGVAILSSIGPKGTEDQGQIYRIHLARPR